MTDSYNIVQIGYGPAGQTFAAPPGHRGHAIAHALMRAVQRRQTQWSVADGSGA